MPGRIPAGFVRRPQALQEGSALLRAVIRARHHRVGYDTHDDKVTVDG